MSGAEHRDENDQDYVDLKDDDEDDDEELDQLDETKHWEKDLAENPIDVTEEPLISKSLKLHRRASQPHFEIKMKFTDINVTLRNKNARAQSTNENGDQETRNGSMNQFKAFFSRYGQESSVRKKQKKYQTDKPNLLTSITEEHEDAELGIIGLGRGIKEEKQETAEYVGTTDSNYNIEDKDNSSKASGEHRKILHNVSGELIYGELVAILGASGGGKTTLVSILSGRLHSVSGLSGDVQLSGHVNINDQDFNLSDPLDLLKLSAFSAYVFQEDIHIPTMTAREDIAFNAMLRLPQSMSMEEKWERVEQILKEMQLSKCANTKIGDESMRGLSGGEKKRVSIACELVTNPSFLILDEPTTGLDSTTSFKLIQLLKHMANELGRLVLTTIHQPSSEIVDLFDKVFIMAKGQVIYFGSPREELLNYLEKKLQLTVPKHTNLLEFFLSKLHSHDSEFFIRSWKHHQETIKKEGGGTYANVMLPQDMHKIEKGELPKKIFTASYTVQFKELLQREMRCFVRRREEWYFRLLMVIFIALCQSVMFNQIDNSCENIQNRRGLDFLTIAFNCAMASILSLLTVPSMSNVIEKERKSNRMYSSILWVTTRALVVIPMTWVQLVVFVGIVKFFIPFNADFGSILVVLGCAMMAVDSIASIVGNATTTSKVAFQISPLIIMPFLVFANYLITKTEIPPALRWLVNLSPWYWALNALATKDFSGVDFECAQVINGVTMTTHLRGNYVLRNIFDIDPDSFGLAIGMLLVLFVGFRLVSFIPLVRRCGW